MAKVRKKLGETLVGWGINRAFDLSLIRLNVPDIAPDGFLKAIGAALLVGAAMSGTRPAAVYTSDGLCITTIPRNVLRLELIDMDAAR